jgi:hypothetical protein
MASTSTAPQDITIALLTASVQKLERDFSELRCEVLGVKQKLEMRGQADAENKHEERVPVERKEAAAIHPRPDNASSPANSCEASLLNILNGNANRAWTLLRLFVDSGVNYKALPKSVRRRAAQVIELYLVEKLCLDDPARLKMCAFSVSRILNISRRLDMQDPIISETIQKDCLSRIDPHSAIPNGQWKPWPPSLKAPDSISVKYSIGHIIISALIRSADQYLVGSLTLLAGSANFTIAASNGMTPMHLLNVVVQTRGVRELRTELLMILARNPLPEAEWDPLLRRRTRGPTVHTPAVRSSSRASCLSDLEPPAYNAAGNPAGDAADDAANNAVSEDSSSD